MRAVFVRPPGLGSLVWIVVVTLATLRGAGGRAEENPAPGGSLPHETPALPGDPGATERLSARIAAQPEDFSAYYQRGLARLRTGDAAGALADFNRTLELQPRHGEALAARANLHADRREFGAALRDARHALACADDSQRGLAYFARARAYSEQGDFSRALKAVEGALRADPHAAPAHFLRGQILEARGEPRRAVEAYVQAVRGDLRDPVLYRKLARLLARFDESNGALETCDRALALWPENVEARSARANLLRQLGDWPRARAAADALAQRPESRSAGLFLRVQILTDSGESDAAFAALENLVKTDSAHEEGWVRLAAAHERKGNRDGVIAATTALLDLRSPTTETRRQALLTRAHAYEGKGDYDHELADAEAAVQLGSPTAQVWNCRGAAYFHKGDFPRAKADLTRTIELNPSHPRSYANRAGVALLTRDWAGVVADTTTALERGRRDPYLLRLRAEALAASQQWAKARADLEESIAGNSDDHYAHNVLAWILATCPEADVRDGPRAVREAWRGCELTEWRYPAVIDTLAAAYAEAGDFANAVNWQHHALAAMHASGPNGVPEAEARLREYAAGRPYRQSPQESPVTKTIRWLKATFLGL